MNCIICNSAMEYYFSKEYIEEPQKSFMKEIGKVNYYKCIECGFVLSKTHNQLSGELWEKLNHDYHHYGESFKKSQFEYLPPLPILSSEKRVYAIQPYLQIATLISILSK